MKKFSLLVFAVVVVLVTTVTTGALDGRILAVEKQLGGYIGTFSVDQDGIAPNFRKCRTYERLLPLKSLEVVRFVATFVIQRKPNAIHLDIERRIMKIEKYSLLKFAIPAVLAIAAAVFQSMAIRQVVETEKYLVLNRDVMPGEVIEGTDLRAEDVSKNFIPEGVIPADEDHIAIDSTVKWKIRKGQLLLRRDIQSGSNRLDIRKDEQPIKFNLEDEQLLAGNFHIGQMVQLQFSNPREDLVVGGKSYRAHSDVEIGPLRIISIDSATAAYASSPNARVQEIQFAVPVNFEEFPFLRYARNSREISLQSIYLRTHK